MVSARCKARLEAPIPCDDVRKLISWRMCRAWELVDSGEVKSLGAAISRAAEEIRAQCALKAAKEEKKVE
jgi:hypothetical protein